ncbi:hypothetical protein ABIC24_007145 [Methylobacterium radiotolerans]
MARAASRSASLSFFGRPPLRPRASAAFRPFHGAFAIEVEEVLGHGTVHLQGKAAVCGGAVELLGEGAEVDLLHPQAVDGAHHLDEGATEAIELPDHEHVLGAQESQRCLKGWSLGAGLSGLLLLEQALAADAGQGVALEVEVLILSRDAGISNEHVGTVPKERFSGNRKADTFLRQKRGRLERLGGPSSLASGKRSFSLHR